MNTNHKPKRVQGHGFVGVGTLLAFLYLVGGSIALAAPQGGDIKCSEGYIPVRQSCASVPVPQLSGNWIGDPRLKMLLSFEIRCSCENLKRMCSDFGFRMPDEQGGLCTWMPKIFGKEPKLEAICRNGKWDHVPGGAALPVPQWLEKGKECNEQPNSIEKMRGNLADWITTSNNQSVALKLNLCVEYCAYVAEVAFTDSVWCCAPRMGYACRPGDKTFYNQFTNTIQKCLAREASPRS